MSRIRVQHLSFEVITRSKWGMTLSSDEEETVAEALLAALQAITIARESEYNNRVEVIEVQTPEMTQ